MTLSLDRFIESELKLGHLLFSQRMIVTCNLVTFGEADNESLTSFECLGVALGGAQVSLLPRRSSRSRSLPTTHLLLSQQSTMSSLSLTPLPLIRSKSIRLVLKFLTQTFSSRTRFLHLASKVFNLVRKFNVRRCTR